MLTTGVNSSLRRMSSYQKETCSVVNGVPSDHFWPARRLTDSTVLSSLTEKLSTAIGIMEPRS